MFVGMIARTRVVNVDEEKHWGLHLSSELPTPRSLPKKLVRPKSNACALGFLGRIASISVIRLRIL